jgi:hypothetical protein
MTIISAKKCSGGFGLDDMIPRSRRSCHANIHKCPLIINNPTFILVVQEVMIIS